MQTKKSLTVVKIGGAILDHTERLKLFYERFKTISGAKIVIHGGGNIASEMQGVLGVAPKKIQGRRVTDEQTLKIVTMVYAGLLNKQLVAGLQAIGKNAIGLSGADGDSIRAHKREVRDIDYGFAGDIETINVSLLDTLLSSGMTPVFCAITHDGEGQLLNTNADTLAAEISKAMSSLYQVQLLYVFDKAGVLEDVTDTHSVIERIDQSTYASLLSDKKIANGMLPKLQTAFDALSHGVLQVHLGTAAIMGDLTSKHTTLCL